MKYRFKKFICIFISVMIMLSSFAFGVSATIDTGTIIEGKDYYIKNTASNLFLNAYDSYTPNQSRLIGTDNQAWILTEYNTGYYTIMNKATETYLTAPQDIGYGEYVILEDFLTPINTALDAHERQLWSFTELENGKYIIQSMSMSSYDLYLSHNDYMGYYGYDVVIDPYAVLDTGYAYYLEWEILPYAYGEARYRFLAYDQPGFDTNHQNRNAYFQPTSSLILNYSNTPIYSNFYNELSAEKIIDMFYNCEVFIIHTHGNQYGFQISPYENLEIIDLNRKDLSTLNLAILLTCNTGKNFDKEHITQNNPQNIVEQMVCRGAETVVGFERETYVGDCNKFAYEVMEQMFLYGNDIHVAINNINYDNYTSDMSYTRVIGGNSFITLN